MASSDKGGRKIGPEHVLRNPAVLYLKKVSLKTTACLRTLHLTLLAEPPVN